MSGHIPASWLSFGILDRWISAPLTNFLDQVIDRLIYSTHCAKYSLPFGASFPFNMRFYDCVSKEKNTRVN